MFTARYELGLQVSFRLTLVFKKFDGRSQTAKTNIYCWHKTLAANLVMLRMSPYRKEIIFLALTSILAQSTLETQNTSYTYHSDCTRLWTRRRNWLKSYSFQKGPTLKIVILLITQLDAQNLVFNNKFISCLYMFRAHVLIRRSKLHHTVSGIITPIGGRLVHESLLQPAIRIPLQRNHTEIPTHIETRTHDQSGDTIESRKLLMMDVLMSETCWV